jgi:hypothetical protein
VTDDAVCGPDELEYGNPCVAFTAEAARLHAQRWLPVIQTRWPEGRWSEGPTVRRQGPWWGWYGRFKPFGDVTIPDTIEGLAA